MATYQKLKSGEWGVRAQGIARHNARIAPLLGTEVSVTMPNGVVVIGVLYDDNHNTQITTAEGRRYRVWGDALEGLLSGERDHARLVCGWASDRGSSSYYSSGMYDEES